VADAVIEAPVLMHSPVGDKGTIPSSTWKV